MYVAENFAKIGYLYIKTLRAENGEISSFCASIAIKTERRQQQTPTLIRGAFPNLTNRGVLMSRPGRNRFQNRQSFGCFIDVVQCFGRPFLSSEHALFS